MCLVRRTAAEVEALLHSIERDGKGVATLLRPYLRLGAKAIIFNVDRSFGHSIAVLIATDREAIEGKVRVKTMGVAGSAGFQAARRR